MIQTLKNKRVVFFIVIVVGFVVFNWWAFEVLNELNRQTTNIGIGFGSVLSGTRLEQAQEAQRQKVSSQRQLIYIGNGVLVLFSLGGYILFLKEQKG